MSAACATAFPGGTFPLECESKRLAEFRPSEIDLPGGALAAGRDGHISSAALALAESSAAHTPPPQPPPKEQGGNDNAVTSATPPPRPFLPKLRRIGSDVAVVRRGGVSGRRFSFIGSDGRIRFFLAMSAGVVRQHNPGRGDERVLSLLRSLSRILESHPECRKRGLSYYVPASFPLFPLMRVVEDDPALCAFGDAYELHCARHGREQDLPIMLFKNRMDAAMADDGPRGDAVLDLRLATYGEVSSNVVSENTFSHYMAKCLPLPHHLWAFKRALCAQSALAAFACYLLSVGGRQPNKMLLSRESGRVLQTDFHLSFDPQTGLCESGEVVPFRLTRNLQCFFTPFAVEGVFLSTLAVAAQAATAHGACTDVHLSLFYRDQAVLYSFHKADAPPAAANPAASAATAAFCAQQAGLIGLSPPSGAELQAIVASNVEAAVGGRLRLICPSVGVEAGGERGSVQKGASGLVEAALNPKNLCRMDPTWLAWL
jgi:transformation/transcription domain-associated protein